MMDFMDSLRRGVDRAGFEMDRFLRANRVRSRINGLRSQVDEEMRQIGRQVVELNQRGELVQEELRQHCERIKQLQAEIAAQEVELEAINRETQTGPEPETTAQQPAQPAPVAAACSSCGAALPEGATFCPRCGTRVSPPAEPSPTPPEQPTA